MTTPVLTKNQQKKSLSAKKGPAKGLKNVLAQPHDSFWPILKNDQRTELEDALKRLLPSLKRPEVKIPWSQLRKMGKAERSNARKEAQAKCDVQNDETIPDSVIFGINAITRSLEKDNVSCVLLDASVDPSLLIKHIVTMAKNKSIPILLISSLKKVTLETIGFATAALALKKNVETSPGNFFYEVFEKISEISLQMIPKIPVSLFQDESSSDEEANSDQKSIQNMEVDIEEVIKPSVISTDLYLYRTSKKERVFEPPNSSKEKQKTEQTLSDFIALGDDKYDIDKKKMPSRFFKNVSPKTSGSVQRKTTKKVIDESEDNCVQSNTAKVHYKPLKVKRIQGNQFRIKAAKAKVKKK